jgi:1-deoxy-D-xylulose-5-phosphate synthase
LSQLLDKINLPDDLKKLSTFELQQLSAEIREFLIKTVADNGGHLAPNLGVVELTLALHSTFDSPRDKIVWDVGHQCYVHKILTGRLSKFHTLRRYGGLSGFPRPQESEHDSFATGHSSTSISAALGLAEARDLAGENYHVIAVIGDGALTGGMAYEALNHAGHIKADMLVVLNDNEMSISSNVGGMSAYLGRIRLDPHYSRIKAGLEHAVSHIPVIGKKMAVSAGRIKGGLKYLMMPGMIFEELGFTYIGPVDGHNIAAMKGVFERARRLKGPVLLHVLTEKGKGYRYAEKSPEQFHGIGPFNRTNGKPLAHKKNPSYTEIFSRTMVRLGRENEKLIAITAAMKSGTGLDQFAAAYPDRFFDVGIAEQHAVTMAASLAAGGFQPVVAVYSTFLQRAYDQIIHDVCMQNLPVIFAVDRAGVVGEDGESHQGLFDLSFLRTAPNMTVAAPRNEKELQNLLYTVLHHRTGPAAIRYPRDRGEGIEPGEFTLLQWGKGELLREGDDVLIVAAGTASNAALAAAEQLFWQGIKAAVIDARFVKPLDRELIMHWSRKCGRVVTVEENVLSGGFGGAVIELLADNGLLIPVKRLGIPDCFIEHGPRSFVLSRYNLDSDGICRAVLEFCRGRAEKGSV